ncbi:hypothetical protein HIO71_13525 [Chryseobacterium aquaticum]|uniref:Uncharacterized protein n=1 Tax=Chryseobacterium aquaticum TaxID=452084 RepID=A0A848N8D9_9FLAO|nr:MULTISPECIES: hypothetical protein [Chryseobacterium]NMR35205.1 hypothetical protein [Chryseobacterium aquaticum]NRQ47358.1 hypothetical protein [Chryseobacterium sp. C-204]
MKNIVKLFSVISCLFFTSKAMAQLDTLNYVKQFEINKAQYINQPFSYLLSQMTQIQPKSHWVSSNPKNKNSVAASQFLFCNMDYIGNRVVTLRILWKESFPRSEVKYYQNKNGFHFTNEEKTFYGNKIIKDILVSK